MSGRASRRAIVRQTEAGDLVRAARDKGITPKQIAAALNRSERMVGKIEAGTTGGELYLDNLRELLDTGAVAEPAPRAKVSEQVTPAGRFTQVTASGLNGLLRSLNRDQFSRSGRVALTIDYLDTAGRDQRGTLYRRGGRRPVDIATDLESLGARQGDAQSIHDALVDFIDAIANDPAEGGDSGLSGVTTITGVSVSPA